MLSPRSSFRRRLKLRHDRLSSIEQLESRVLLSASVFSISDSQAVEGDSGETEMVFTVSRFNEAGDYSAEESVPYFTDPIPNRTSAATPYQGDPSVDDYSYVNRGIATFAPGETITQVSILVYGDQREEQNEGLLVRLSPRTEFSQVEVALDHAGVLTYGSFVDNIIDRRPTVLLFASEPTLRVLVYVNLAGAGQPPQLSLFATLPTPSSNSLIVKADVADFDGDGYQDIVVADQTGLFIYRQTVEMNTGAGTGFSAPYAYMPGSGIDLSDFWVGDVNHDSKPDLVIADRNTSTVSFLINDISAGSGEIAFLPQQTLTVAAASGLSRVRLAVLDDGYSYSLVALVNPPGVNSTLAIARINIAGNGTTLEFNSGLGFDVPVLFNGQSYPANGIKLNLQAHDLEVGDLSGDGRVDLVVATEEGADATVLRIFDNQTEDSYSPLSFTAGASPFTIGHNPGSPFWTGYNVELADFNQDGRVGGGIYTDLAGLVLFERSPDITAQLLSGGGGGQSGYNFGDLNGDGAPDLLFPAFNGELSWSRNTTIPIGYTFQSVAMGTIIDDDHPQVQLSVSRSSLLAGDYGDYGDQSRTIVRAELANGQVLTHDLSVQLVLDPASTAYGDIPYWPDFVITNGFQSLNLVIPAGASYAEVEITAQPDAPDQTEPDETIILNAASSAEFSLANVDPIIITIVSVPELRLAITNNVVTEDGNNLFDVVVYASKPMLVDTDVYVEFSESESTATRDDILTNGFNLVHIPAGQRVGTLTMGAGNDTLPEQTEYATYRLGEVLNGIARVSTESHVVVTILDDDGVPPVAVPVIDLRRVLSDGTLTTSFTTINESGGTGDLVAVIDSPVAYDIAVTLTASGNVGNTEYSKLYEGQSSTSQLPTLVIPAGATRSTVLQIRSVDDSTPESIEVLELAVAAAPGIYSVGDRGPVAFAVVDDDTASPVALPVIDLRRVLSDGTLTSSFTTIAESGGNGDLVAVIDSPVSYAVSVTLAASGSLSRAEYTTTYNGTSSTSTLPTLVIPAGATRSSVLRIQSVDDAVVEANETLELSTISVPGSYTVGVRGPVAFAVLDNDAVSPVLPVIDLRRVLSDGSLTTSFTTISETNGSSDLVAVLDSPLSYPISITLTATGTLSRVEYSTTYNGQTSTSQLPTLVIPAGATRSTVLRMQSLDDSVLESDETLELSVVAASGIYTVGVRGPISLIVIDNDATPSPLPVVDLRRIAGGGGFLPSTASIAEAAGGTQIVAVIDTPLTHDLTVVVTASGTLSRAEFLSAYNNGTSSTTQLQTLTIPAGATRSPALLISTIDDSLPESDETLTLAAVALPGIYTVGTRGPINLTIIDDDTLPPQLTIRASAPAISENNGVAGFLVTLDRPATGTITVQLGFSGTALATDYTALSTVVIASGQTSGLAWIKGTDDVYAETDETVIATITSISGIAQIASSPAMITIVDDDYSRVARLIYQNVPASANLPERGGRGVVTALLDGPTAYPVVIRLGFSGTATLGTDYTASGATLTIPVGGASASIDLLTIPDQFVEGAESITVTIVLIDALSDGRVVAVPAALQNSITVSIQDDQRPLLVSRLATLTVEEDQTSSPHSFRVYEQNVLFVGVTEFEVVSSNPDLISAADVTIAFRNAVPRSANQDNRQITVKPKPNQSGTATLTIRAINEAGTEVMTLDVVVTPVNDPPSIVGNSYDAFEMSILEDLPLLSNGGVSVLDLISGYGSTTRANSLSWFEVDPEPNLRGIAITGAGRANGNWQYSINDGVTWKPLVQSIGPSPKGVFSEIDVMPQHALLLAADARELVRIRYLPNPNYHGYSNDNYLNIVAWDQTYGISGSYVNLETLTGPARTAFGSSGRVKVEVISTNDFPPVIQRFGAGGPIFLPTIPEEQRGQPIPEFTMSEIRQLLSNSGVIITDEDLFYQVGVAIQGDNGSLSGNWEVNMGAGWTSFEKPILLLSFESTARLRFNSNYGGTDGYTLGPPKQFAPEPPRLIIRGWDYAAGQSDSFINEPLPRTILAGSLSVDFVPISVHVQNINDPPHLSGVAGQPIGAIILDDDIFSPEGIDPWLILQEFYNSQGLVPHYATMALWLESLDGDDNQTNHGGDIGLAVMGGVYTGFFQYNYSGDYRVNSPNWHDKLILGGNLGEDNFLPLAAGSRIRITGSHPSTYSDFYLTFKIHDGGRTLAGDPVLTDSPAHRLSPETFTVFVNSSGLTAASSGTSGEVISTSSVQSAASNTVEWWVNAGLSTASHAFLTSANYLPLTQSGATLGSAENGFIFIDLTAAGIGWFIDPTPFLDEEYELSPDGILRAIPGGIADGKYDLLTVLAHEQGHLLGLNHPADSIGSSVMTELLEPGIRRKPTADDLDLLFAVLADPESAMNSETE